MDESKIQSAIEALSIRAVLLRATSVTADAAVLPPANEDQSFHLRNKSSPIGEIEIRTVSDDAGRSVTVVVFEYRAAVRLVSPSEGEDDAEPIIKLQISADFAAHYTLRSGIDPDQIAESLQEFAKHNVGYHVWPYWREYVQSVSARMGIPPIPIGMYKVPAERRRRKALAQGSAET